jgi:glycosyltransferase involved in cell wall biosynthesis
MFPGHANPLKMPRYRWGKPLAGWYDSKLSAALQDVDVILACADGEGIRDIAGRSKGLLPPDRIVQFPTRVDTTIFRPQPATDTRRKLGLHGPGPFVVTCGRISEVKGWDLLISAFPYFMQTHADARLIFVGDGEDRPALEQTIARQDLTRSVSLAGFQSPGKVAEYLNAADLVVVGSYKEGWSVAMLEALACARVVVSTEVSGARDMIEEGRNGRVVQGRDPRRFAAAMTEALEMERPNPVSLKTAERYSLSHLRSDLSMFWEPFADSTGIPEDRLEGAPAAHLPFLHAGRRTE